MIFIYHTCHNYTCVAVDNQYGIHMFYPFTQTKMIDVLLLHCLPSVFPSVYNFHLFDFVLIAAGTT